MPTEVIKLSGLRETVNALKELDRKVQRQAVRSATRAGAKVILAAAQAAAPVLSGLTRSALKLRSGGSGKGSYRMTVGVGDADYAGQTFYAAFVLFGHRVGSRRLGDARQMVPANNWLLKAMQDSQETAAQTTSDALIAGVESEADKHG